MVYRLLFQDCIYSIIKLEIRLNSGLAWRESTRPENSRWQGRIWLAIVFVSPFPLLANGTLVRYCIQLARRRYTHRRTSSLPLHEDRCHSWTRVSYLPLSDEEVTDTSCSDWTVEWEGPITWFLSPSSPNSKTKAY